MVVLAQLKALETRRSPAERHAWKVRLVKGLYERGMDSEGVRRLFEAAPTLRSSSAGR